VSGDRLEYFAPELPVANQGGVAVKSKGKRISIAAGVLAAVILGLSAWLSWPEIRLWWDFAPLGRNAQGYPEYRHRKTGIVFVSLPGGTF
jgi:hypothetical protein